MKSLSQLYSACMSSRVRHFMEVWSVRAWWIFGLLGLLCLVDYIALDLLAEQEFLSQEGHDHASYESMGNPYLPILAAGALSFTGALLMLVLRIPMGVAEFFCSFRN